MVVAADGTARVIDRHTPPATSAGSKSATKKPAPPRPLWRRAAGRVKRALTNEKKS
ncbi:hypothetical protein GCM10023238_28530 [Streptomyces heliomycini]